MQCFIIVVRSVSVHYVIIGLDIGMVSVSESFSPSHHLNFWQHNILRILFGTAYWTYSHQIQVFSYQIFIVIRLVEEITLVILPPGCTSKSNWSQTCQRPETCKDLWWHCRSWLDVEGKGLVMHLVKKPLWSLVWGCCACNFMNQWTSLNSLRPSGAYMRQ